MQFVVTLSASVFVNGPNLCFPSNNTASHLFTFLGQFQIKVSTTSKGAMA